MLQPKISIIIPVYNTEKYLRECLDSVLSQTLQDIEIIVVNDASPDHSQDIIDEYVAKDARIQCIVHPENLGQGEARNKGIAVARGEYITFVDSDDWIDQHCYATVIEKMEANGANLGVLSVENFDEESGSTWTVPYFDFPYSSAQKITAQNITQIPDIMCAKVFRREDVQQDILRLSIHLKREDVEFWFKYASWVQPLAVGVLEKFYHYRQHSASTMANCGLNDKDYPKILQNIGNYLAKVGLYSEYRSAFEEKVIESLAYYEKLLAEYREQYCCDMRHLFEQCHLTMAELPSLNPNLGVYYIEDELLRQYFLQFQQDHGKLKEDHGKLKEDHGKLQQDHGKLQQDHVKLQQDHVKLQQNRWYRFGKLSRKRKLWVIARALSKKLRIYKLFRPVVKQIKPFLGRK